MRLLAQIENAIDLEQLLGRRSCEILRGGYKIELEGATNPRHLHAPPRPLDRRTPSFSDATERRGREARRGDEYAHLKFAGKFFLARLAVGLALTRS